MVKYILIRVSQAALVLLLATVVTFGLVIAAPGDPVLLMLQKRADQTTIDSVRHELGLDRPLLVQYADFLYKAVHFDFGKSYSNKIPVKELVMQAFPVTLKLGLFSLLFATVFGITVGTVCAVFRGKIVDKILMLLAMLQISTPVFWFAMLLQILFGLKLHLLPISGMSHPLWMALPVTVLGLRWGATSARLIRTYMLEALSQDYVRTAKAKGVADFFVVMKLVFKNAAIPILTLLGGMLRSLLSGAFVVERVFGIQGLGKLAIDAVMARDINIIQATVMYSALLFVAINLIVDLSYGLLDPRIRIVGEGK
jgi:peptide/nickel transport system permease protein